MSVATNPFAQMSFSVARSAAKVAVTALAFAAIGCAGGNNPDHEEAKNLPANQKISGQPVQLKGDGSTLVFSEEGVAGNGSVRFVDPLPNANEGRNFELAFTLEDLGEVELVTFSNADLERGLSFRFVRTGKDLSGSMKLGETIVQLTQGLGNIDASGVIRLTLDVHNNESPAHVILWSGTREQAAAKTIPDLYNSEEHDADPRTPEADQVPGKGADSSWGLRLKRAKVLSAKSAEEAGGH